MGARGMLRMVAGACALAVTATMPAADAQGEGLTLYVSPEGDDAWSGTLAEPDAERTDGPLRTPAAARNALRRIRDGQDGAPHGPVTVFLRGGVYRLDKPLVFGPQDSGTADAPVTFRAFDGERPIISGGQVLLELSRGDDGAWRAHIPSVAAGEWYFRQLLLAPSEEGPFERRYRPTEGPFVIAGLTDAPEHDSTMAHRRSQDQFRFHEGDIRRFERIEDVEVVALHSWSSSRLRIREVDLQERIVRFTGHPVYRIGHWYRGGRNPYFVENVREAFGEPGEWYLDRPTGTLSYTPLAGEDPSELTFVAPRIERLVRIEGDAEAGRFVEHLRLEGLSFAHTRWRLPQGGYSAGQGMTNLPGAVQVRWARRCAVRGCTLAHLGAYAVDIGAGCSECEVVGCRIFDLGGGGVKVGGPGRDAQPPELPTGNLVADNLISDGGVDHFSAHGIWVGITDGTRVLHNLVRRFLYSTVSVGWSWDDHPTSCTNNVVAHNHLHDAMMLLSDGGGIYTLGFQPGTVLRGNRIHDVHSSPFAGGAPNNGIFFDQGSKGYAVEDNVIYAIADDPIRFNGGGRHLHHLSGNSLGVAPGEEGFPGEIAAQAGLEPEFAHLDDRPTDVPTTPILAMTPPPPPPIHDGFEHSALGSRPGNAIVQGAEEPASIAVTEEVAASGQRSLKITDATGLTKPFYPYVIYEPGFEEGVATVRVSLFVEPGARAWVEAREYGGGYTVGPSLTLHGDGRLEVGDETLQVAGGRWIQIELRVPLGDEPGRTWRLAVTPKGEETREVHDLPLDAGFRHLDWLGFIAAAEADAAFYLDDISVTRDAPEGD